VERNSLPGSQSTSRTISYRTQTCFDQTARPWQHTLGKLVRLEDQNLLLFFPKGRPTPRKPADRDEIREIYSLYPRSRRERVHSPRSDGASDSVPNQVKLAPRASIQSLDQSTSLNNALLPNSFLSLITHIGLARFVKRVNNLQRLCGYYVHESAGLDVCAVTCQLT